MMIEEKQIKQIIERAFDAGANYQASLSENGPLHSRQYGECLVEVVSTLLKELRS